MIINLNPTRNTSLLTMTADFEVGKNKVKNVTMCLNIMVATIYV